MARLQSQTKLLYYPTPPVVVEQIASWFTARRPYRAADPCAGDGTALALFVASVGVEAETWGVELSQTRAEQAEDRLNVVLPASFYHVRWSPRSVSLAFNNPPYDWSSRVDLKTGNKIRHERLFVVGTTEKLVAGGHQIIIIPRKQLADETMARHLAGWYERLIVRRFPDDEYKRFKQIVILAISRRAKYVHPTKDAIQAITDLAEDEDTVGIPVLSYGDGDIIIPPKPSGKFRFNFIPVDPQSFARLARKVSPIGTTAWRQATHVPPLGARFTPALPPKIGHIAMQVSSGDAGVLTFDGMVAKGVVRKVIDRTDTDVTDDDGEFLYRVVETRERLETIISVLDEDGNARIITDRDEVAEFITGHADEIADALLKRNAPIYDFKPTPREWEIAARIGKELPPLPGRAERGLFDAQKHLAIGAARVIQRKRHAIINAEMGFGKTITAVCTAELLNAWPALVVCPGHMVYKWVRIFEQGSDPNDPITARVITYPVRGKSAWLHTTALPLIESAGGQVVEYHRFQVAPKGRGDNGCRIRFRIRCEDQNISKILSVIRKSFAFYGRHTRIQPQISLDNGDIIATVRDRDEYTLFDFFNDYDAGRLGRKAVAIVGFDAAKFGPGINKKPDRKGYRIARRNIYDEDTHKWRQETVAVCPRCGAHYFLGQDIPDFCDNVRFVDVFDESGKKVGTRPVKCNAPLFEMSRWRREGLSRLVQRKFRRRFKLYIADEIHKQKGGKTDVGTADGRLVASIPRGLALTGTLFGGYASSIFYLLYRRNPEVRRLYHYSDVIRWVDHFGMWEKIWKENKPRDTERGASTGIRRWSLRSRELPGVSPMVIRYLLPITLFGKITDLGYALPPLHEHVDIIEMSPAQREQYAEAKETLKKRALKVIKEYKDAGALSVYFATLRYRPMSAFRYEVAEYPGMESLYMDAVVDANDPWLPKETRLAEIVRKNSHRGIKTLVFVEQTGKRDIRPRLKEALESLVSGVRVASLSAGDMRPAEREAWIVKETSQIDVLLVNPSLVETGLDLTMFSHLVFYELPTSLYTLWQAMRRVWRLGQRNAVHCHFLVYGDSLEFLILDRLGKKLKAAMLLYGDEAVGALIETDDDDVLREMLRGALAGKSYENLIDKVSSEPIRVFSQADGRPTVVTESPMGSPVAISPPLPVLSTSGEMKQLGLWDDGDTVSPVQVKRKHRRRKGATRQERPFEQLALWN